MQTKEVACFIESCRANSNVIGSSRPICHNTYIFRSTRDCNVTDINRYFENELNMIDSLKYTIKEPFRILVRLGNVSNLLITESFGPD